MQITIVAIFLFQQKVVAALLDNPAFIHRNDPVTAAHSRQAMGDDQDGAIVADGFHVCHDRAFGFVIERAGGFIQNQNARIGDQRPGNGNALTLSPESPAPCSPTMVS